MAKAQIIDGREIAQKYRDTIKQDVEAFIEEHALRPSLAVILVGEHPASEIYVRNKQKACELVGIDFTLIRRGDEISQDELLAIVDNLNNDTKVHGILMQLPLPDHITASVILERISPSKDVDGLHPYNLGQLVSGRPKLMPCTPMGCLQLIQECVSDISGLKACVIGRSVLVGKPMAALLTHHDVTVTLAHSKTKGLRALCQNSDIIIAAMGQPKLIKGAWVKPGAIVIDVGINQMDAGGERKLCGDVDFDSASEQAGYITPVPGGVGPMTITNLLLNVLKAARQQV